MEGFPLAAAAFQGLTALDLTTSLRRFCGRSLIVQASVREHLQHLDDGGARADVVDVAALLDEHDPELLAALEALADELSIARLEDVQRHPLGRHQHELEREEADSGHAESLRLWIVRHSSVALGWHRVMSRRDGAGSVRAWPSRARTSSGLPSRS